LNWLVAAALNVVDQLLNEIEDRNQEFKRVMQSLKPRWITLPCRRGRVSSIDDKTNYLIVTARLHTIMTIHENAPPIDDTASIRNQHDALSQLAVFPESL
jgi:hypothetical protein